MFFRPRSSRPNKITRKARGVIAAAAAQRPSQGGMIEDLESRTLLTTLTGGGTGQESSFEYIAENNQVYRISLRGNITATFIGIDVPKLRDVMIGGVSVKRVVPSTPRAVDLRVAIASPPENYGVDLYAIYISQSDPDASIAIAAVPALTAQDRPMQPFTGSPGDFTIVNARTGQQDAYGPDGAGGVLIGGKTGNTIDSTTDEEDRHINSIVLKSRFGERPASPKGKLDAGITTAPGINIGQILIGGVVTGRVNITGSIDTFYAGQILTGDAEGIFNGQGPTIPANFVIGGDAKNIISFQSIGCDDIDDAGINRINDIDYKTGVDMIIRGRVGQIMTKGSFLGALSVENDPTFKGVGTNFSEIEVRDSLPKLGDASFFQGNDFSFDVQKRRPSLGDNPAFNNDTLATAQFLGTQKNTALRSNSAIRVRGEINDFLQAGNDRIDYYAITLLAGQTAQVQVQEADVSGTIIKQPSNNFIAVGVLDPDGRVEASDLSNNDLAATLGKPFRFTAKIPGVYYIAVANADDFDFSGAFNGDELPVEVGIVPYILDITRVGDLALGAIVADDGIANNDFLGTGFGEDPNLKSIQVLHGDLGGLISTTAGVGSGNAEDAQNSYILAESSQPITVSKGNLRAMVAGSIGLQNGGTTAWGPNLHVPKGSVGLLRATGVGPPVTVDYVLSVNPDLVNPNGSFSKSDAIGYDYQLVDAARIMDGNLLADRGIGVVRAETISSDFHAPRFAVNADLSGNDGFIDEIDARGDGFGRGLGTLQAGGPQISTGPSGNVRYMHTSGPMYRDRFFGGGSQEFRSLAPGAPFRYTDDSGTSVKLTPLPQNNDANNQLVNPTSLTLRTYGIRDKGGSVLVSVDVSTITITDPATLELQSGIQIDSGNGTGSGTVEIGEITMAGTGSPITFDPVTRSFVTTSTASEPVAIIMKGRRNIDVFNIIGENINTLDNRTGGEIVNVVATNLGAVSVNNFGIAKSTTGSMIQSVDILRDVFPFKEQRTLIDVFNNIVSINARGAVGNIWLHGAVQTAIGTINANSDRRNDKAVFEGIDGPIVGGVDVLPFTPVEILSVNIGEGITPSGSGDYEWSGIFLTGGIVNLTNQGLGSDIRGDIVTGISGLAQPGGTTTDGDITSFGSIGRIHLIDGSIIDADILVDQDWTDALDSPQVLTLVSIQFAGGEGVLPVINSIELEGIGGILGSFIGANGLGGVTIRGGFGFVDSTVLLEASSNFTGIDTDGYGIRFSVIDGGSTIDHILARGTGKILSTNEYSPSVRNSERLEFDSQSGRLLSRNNDLHKFLGTTKAHPKNLTNSVAGTIQDSLFTGARNLNRLEAYRIFGTPDALAASLPGVGSVSGGISAGSDDSPMRISFAERVAKTVIRESIDGLQFTAGNVSNFDVGNNIAHTAIEVDGVIGSMSTGNLKSSATVQALGNEGRIDNFTTKRALFGVVNAASSIGKLTVGTDLASRSVSSSNDIGTVTINGSILSGALLRAADQISILNVGRNIDDGATVRAKRIGQQNIKGEVNGDIVIG